MTAIVRLTRAELRKLTTVRTFPVTLGLSVGLAVTSVIANAAAAGRNGRPALGTTASTDQMLKLGAVCCMAMLVLGIIAAGGEYRHKTIIPAMLAAPDRGTLVTVKVIGIIVAGVVLAGLTFGLGLVTTAAELGAHGLHHLPADTGRLFAGSVIAAILFGVMGSRSDISPAAPSRPPSPPSAGSCSLKASCTPSPPSWPSGWSPVPPLP